MLSVDATSASDMSDYLQHQDDEWLRNY